MSNTYSFEIIENTFITLKNGQRLAARIWMPNPLQVAEHDSGSDGFPTVLEYLPYRKRDGTTPRDDSTYPAFARAGIVGVRVDMSGHGDSDGDFDDEYSQRELDQGVEIINWIAGQSWSNGNVGMMGISWGGFNGLQIAAMHPELLKAVISISSTVDRYNDDIHYKNGCLLYSNFYWANVMLMYASRPADPLIREDWKELWKHRLDTQPWLLQTWLEHSNRDDYWKHGSICENYAGYNTPTLIIGGWADLYMNAPPALAANSSGVCKAINGPWIHKYPHFAFPKPRLDFHQEAINWWNHWLRDEPNAVEQLPDYRAFISQATTPGGWREREQGHWVASDTWPAPSETRQLYPTTDKSLSDNSGTPAAVEICSPQDCGIACGEMFSLSPDSDLADDQRIDDGGSLVFQTEPLTTAVEILGRPQFKCDVSIDQPLGNLCARLVDVHPDGRAYRVSWAVLNLAHRSSQEHPEAMTPGKTESIEMVLNECGYRFEPGHRIQLSLSTSYWPAIQPPPSVCTATIELGNNTCLQLPLNTGTQAIDLPEPADPKPLPEFEMHSEASNRRWVERDFQAQRTHYHVKTDSGLEELPNHALKVRHLREETWSIEANNPLSATATGTHTWWSSRDDWAIKIECGTSMSCDKTHHHIQATVRAWLNDELFNERSWEHSVPRGFN